MCAGMGFWACRKLGVGRAEEAEGNGGALTGEGMTWAEARRAFQKRRGQGAAEERASVPLRAAPRPPWERLSPTERLLALEDAYRSMLIVPSADSSPGLPSGVLLEEFVDSDELELIVAALVDLDEVGGRLGSSLLAQAATSPDVATRQALANALAAAPSPFALGNAGLGALQRLAGDPNPTISEAASKALQELQQQFLQQEHEKEEEEEKRVNGDEQS
eukprot:TRINITY_DN1818_c0_g1_i2.p1 TRINITY_DN1818_c0_g1~~TRINITY_DN1818_c0_g1_i2.p1  ORF type:complete len:219 (+),score=65.93 TRINITY_DN1818_c0_g1_i2:263-919(+)